MHLEPDNVTALKLDLFHYRRMVLTSQLRLVLSRLRLVNYQAEQMIELCVKLWQE